MPEHHLRAADADRTAVATALGEAMSEGRLTVAEYDERLTRAYGARTFGELAELTADLPRPGTVPAPRAVTAPRTAPHPGAACGGRGGYGGPAWGSWSSTAVIVLAVWAITSLVAWELLYFWPFWVIVPWGAMLLIGSVGTRSRRGDQRLTS